jgi:hypothetical protein
MTRAEDHQANEDHIWGRQNSFMLGMGVLGTALFTLSTRIPHVAAVWRVARQPSTNLEPGSSTLNSLLPVPDSRLLP